MCDYELVFVLAIPAAATLASALVFALALVFAFPFAFAFAFALALALAFAASASARLFATLFIGGDPRLLEYHTLRRIVEIDARAAELVDDAEIHGLLQIEQRIEAGLLREVGEFEVQGGIAEGLQMTAVETRVRLLADDALEQLGDGPKRVGRRVVVDADGRQRALLQGAAVIAHAAF